MVRTFALVVLDNRDKVKDRFSLDLISDPEGLGFKLEISTIITDIEEIPVDIKQSLKSVTLKQNYAYGNEYARARALRNWIMQHTRSRMALEWTTSIGSLYADCKVETFDFSELTTKGYLSIPLSIKLLSPFFEIIENAIQIYPSTTGKQYTYSYPYTYGIGVISNNEITNDYIKPIPLLITLYGEMMSPIVSIIEKDTSTPYATVAFSIALAANTYLVIDAIRRKITYFNGYYEEDGYQYLDPTQKSYIFAKENAVSFLDAAGVRSDSSGYMEASYRRYRL